MWNGEGIRHIFYQLDKDGEEEYSLFFFERDGYNKKTKQGEIIYMVALPQYANNNKQIEITREMKKQAYFDGLEYHFRVTEEQYNELTKAYYTAWDLAEENLKKFTFTYDELWSAKE